MQSNQVRSNSIELQHLGRSEQQNEAQSGPIALDIVQFLAKEFPPRENLLEPWHVLSEDGSMGATTALRVVAHAKFGTGAIIRPRILILVQEKFAENGIELEG